jgi:hypothetical protein
MSSLTDFDDQVHRAQAAAAAFQKGVYQLFILRNERTTDSYDRLLRSYQCVFQLCVALVLVDERFTLNPIVKRGLGNPLKRKCNDEKSPKRDELDPACVITHSVFEKAIWKGFPAGHSLAAVAIESLALHSRVNEARHNLLYRPFLLNGPHWEDCTLIGLLGTAPTWQDIEAAYKNLATGISEWRSRDRGEGTPLEFIFTLFRPFEVRGGARPTESVLLMYARMLGGDKQSIAELAAYRNELVGALAQAEHFPTEWSLT